MENKNKNRYKRQDFTEGHKRFEQNGKSIQGSYIERLNILKMSILLKLIYTCKAISKGFFSPPITLQIEPKIYRESSLLKNSRSYMQKK